MEGKSAGPETSGSRERRDGVDFATELQLANTNRSLTAGIAGTSVAILTFTLFFMYDRVQSGAFSPLLFRATVADLIVAVFGFAFSGANFAWQVEALVRQPSRAGAYARWGGWMFVLGLFALLAAPALILYTAAMPEVATPALALWLVMVVLILRRRPLGR